MMIWHISFHIKSLFIQQWGPTPFFHLTYSRWGSRQGEDPARKIMVFRLGEWAPMDSLTVMADVFPQTFCWLHPNHTPVISVQLCVCHAAFVPPFLTSIFSTWFNFLQMPTPCAMLLLEFVLFCQYILVCSLQFLKHSSMYNTCVTLNRKNELQENTITSPSMSSCT